MVRFITALAAILVAGSAQAQETWVGHQVFKSGVNACATSQTVDYTYSWDGKTFTVSNRNGRMLTTEKVAANGTVDEAFKSSTGNRLKVSGNVLTKDLYISNTEAGCTWATPPKK